MKSDNKEGYNVSVLFCLKKIYFVYTLKVGLKFKMMNLFQIADEVNKNLYIRFSTV